MIGRPRVKRKCAATEPDHALRTRQWLHRRIMDEGWRFPRYHTVAPIIRMDHDRLLREFVERSFWSIHINAEFDEIAPIGTV